MESLKIGGKILQWTKNFLQNRKQAVRVNNCLSLPTAVLSGVPQGSVLGPLLFLILMIDIDKDILHAALGSFADDTRLWEAISDLQNRTHLQQDLNTVYSWAHANNMEFNDGKFKGISFGASSDYFPYNTPTGKSITKKESLMDLGITFDQDARFKTHILNITAKGHRMAAWATRVFTTRATDTMLTILKSLIVRLMEYACIIWSPADSYHIDLLERVQRRFTSKMAIFLSYDDSLDMPICTVHYHERLKQLKIYSLERRRDRYSILYLYKIILGMVPNPGLSISHNPRTGTQVKPKYNSKRSVPRSTQTTRNASFFVRAPIMYNNLPLELRNHAQSAEPTKESVNTFKSLLDKHLANIPDLPGTLANSLAPKPLE